MSQAALHMFVNGESDLPELTVRLLAMAYDLSVSFVREPVASYKVTWLD